MDTASIRQLTDKDSLDELTLLLHRGYKKLAEQGFRYTATHQDIETTRKRITGSECYIATINNKMVATIVYKAPSNTSGCPWYDQPFVASLEQFAVEPALQKQGIGSELISLVEELAMRDEAEEISLNTAERATDLIHYYTKRGYRFVDYVQWEGANYRSVILSKKLVYKRNSLFPPTRPHL